MTNREQELFENASVMLEVCRGVFERNGFIEEAERLRGLEATSLNTAYASLRTVQFIRARNSETRVMKQQVLMALRPLFPNGTPLAS